MRVSTISNSMDSFAQDFREKLEKVYEDFEDDGELTEDDKVSEAVQKLNETCDLLEGTKFDDICNKITEMISEIADLSEGAISLNDDEMVEEEVQKDIEREEEKFEKPRARWGHD